VALSKIPDSPVKYRTPGNPSGDFLLPKPDMGSKATHLHLRLDLPLKNWSYRVRAPSVPPPSSPPDAAVEQVVEVVDVLHLTLNMVCGRGPENIEEFVLTLYGTHVRSIIPAPHGPTGTPSGVLAAGAYSGGSTGSSPQVNYVLL